MHPSQTLYRLATTPADYRRCHVLLRSQGATHRLAFPTVLAERGGTLLGFLSTNPNDRAIVAGPLVLMTNGHNLGIVAMRLIEAYERILTLAGVASYHFAIPRGDAFEPWRNIVNRVGIMPYAETETHWWYKRELT